MIDDEALAQLYAVNLARMKAALNYAASGTSVFNERSPVWTELLAPRPEFAQLSDLQNMFSGRSAVFGSSTGGTVDRVAQEKRYHYVVERFDGFLTPQVFASTRQTNFGAPATFEHRGFKSNEWFVYNAAMAQLVVNTLAVLGLPQQNLTMLEIGGGYGGMAEVLIQQHVVRDIHFIDLHENLFVTLMYMGAHQPTYATHFVGEGASSAEKPTLYFYPPQATHEAHGPFDVAVNTSSLGEMPRGTAHAYVQHVATVLKPAGIFISHNASNAYANQYRAQGREHDGLRRLSDFGYLAMEVKYLRASPAPGGLDYDLHHHIVCGVKTSASPAQAAADLDTIGFLINCHFSAEIEGLCDAFVAGAITAEQRRFLSTLQAMFAASEFAQKKAALAASFGDENLERARVYLLALIGLASADYDLFAAMVQRYLKDGRSPIALCWGALFFQVLTELVGTPHGDFTKHLGGARLAAHFVSRAHEIYARHATTVDRLKYAQEVLWQRLNPL